MKLSFKGIAGAVLGLALGAALAAPASAQPTSGGPAPAASSDYGIFGISSNSLTLNYGGSFSPSLVGSGMTYGSDGSSSTSSLNVGSMGGVTYGSTLSFNLTGFGNLVNATNSGSLQSSSLTLNYGSIVGTPILTAMAFSSSPTGIMPVGSAGLLGQQFNLASSSTPGSTTLSFSQSFSQSLDAAIKANPTAPLYLQVALNAAAPVTGGGNGGAGVPGPIAGAGLPFLAVAGLAWMRRRRQTRLAA